MKKTIAVFLLSFSIIASLYSSSKEIPADSCGLKVLEYPTSLNNLLGIGV